MEWLVLGGVLLGIGFVKEEIANLFDNVEQDAKEGSQTKEAFSAYRKAQEGFSKLFKKRQ